MNDHQQPGPIYARIGEWSVRIGAHTEEHLIIEWTNRVTLAEITEEIRPPGEDQSPLWPILVPAALILCAVLASAAIERARR